MDELIRKDEKACGEQSVALSPFFRSGFELFCLWTIVTLFVLAHWLCEAWGWAIGSLPRAQVNAGVFAFANLCAALLCWQGLRWIRLQGLVRQTAMRVSTAIWFAATSNVLSFIMWLTLQTVNGPYRLVPFVLFLFSILFGIWGMFKLARLAHVSLGVKTFHYYIGTLGTLLCMSYLLSPDLYSSEVMKQAHRVSILFHVVFTILISIIAAVSLHNCLDSSGRLRHPAQLISAGTILLCFGCSIYASVQVRCRLDELQAWASPAFVILALSYVTIGLGVFRMGSRVVESFAVQTESLPATELLQDFFGQDLGLRLYDELLGRIRTSEDALRRVTAEKVRAEEANLAKSRFLVMMSHELRTPLTMLIGYANMLAHPDEFGEQVPPATQLGERILTSSHHLKKLIEGILDFSAIEQGKIVVRAEEFPASELIDFARSFGESQAASRNIDFRLVVEGCAETISSDPQMLRQILVNLLNNAFKFTRQGSVTLKLEFQSGRLGFAVTDTGIGIASEHLERIFMPFYQVSQGRNRKFGGVGLGLTIVQRQIEALGGTIRVESDEGQGSTFAGEVPLRSMANAA
ncbi:MAG TPA: ATP-binding protein [Candidatus Ozemobacteraceae bacterium]|nr:ATP-binding protein [Candidatus Ozemobacteraceae bacterium]